MPLKYVNKNRVVPVSKVEESIGYKFKNQKLLIKAFTHTSYAYENGVQSNEKLEFLGDSILEYISSKYIYNNYPNLKEGEMTKVRAEAVCEKSLYKVAQKHNFSDFLLLGKSEIIGEKTVRPAILADSVEALIAAIYFDAGLDEVEKFIISNIKDTIEYSSNNIGMKDYKTVLQEKLQEHGSVNIEYIITKEEGPDHDKTFTACVKCNGEILASGKGKNKKSAEMDAAKKALMK